MPATTNGASLSVWLDTADLPTYPPLPGELDTEVCIVGVGIAGLSTAYLLAREGREGAVVLDGLRKIAVYRDAQGALHAVSAKCTHLGCAVHWNSAERSWDCPCHASRFDIEGTVLHGPAPEPLEKIELADGRPLPRSPRAGMRGRNAR